MNNKQQIILLSGPRNLSRLPQEVKVRLEEIIKKEFFLIVGDDQGADNAFQEFLVEHEYNRVSVYCPGYYCKNNLGDWHIYNVSTPAYKQGYEIYAHRDMQMARDADYGLVIWSGKKSGPQTNIQNMIILGKKCLVFNSQTKNFSVISDRNLKELHC